MALISYSLQLSSKSSNAGRGFNVFYSDNCSEYTFAGTVDLPTTESIEYIDIEDTSTCIKLQSIGNCTNEVVSGSTPSSSSYNTQLITLTQKNGAGPNFSIFENTGSLYNYVKDAELAQGGTTTFEAGTPLNAVRLRSQGVCTNQKEVQVEVPPTPTPSPTPVPTPTPTPSPTPAPTATPGPTPTNCYTFYTIYASVDSATDACCNVFETRGVYLNAPSLAEANAVYTSEGCGTLRTTPTYYTQDLNEYYYWNGSSFSEPLFCPGCP